MLTSTEFVDAAYQGILKRSADPLARAEYVEGLRSGAMDPAGLLAYFSSLSEFFARCRPQDPGLAIASLYSGEDPYGDPFTWFEGAGHLAHFHIPKTAGTSLVKLLSEPFHPLQLGHGFRRVPAGPLSLGQWQRFYSWHMTAEEHDRIPEPKTTIMCVRDPFARVLSFFRFMALIAPAGKFQPAAEAARSLPAKEFLQSTDPLVRNEVDNAYTRYLANAFVPSDGGPDPLAVSKDGCLEAALRKALSFEGLFFLEQIGGDGVLPAHVQGCLNAFFAVDRCWRLPRINVTASDHALSEREAAHLREIATPLTAVDAILFDRLKRHHRAYAAG